MIRMFVSDVHIAYDRRGFETFKALVLKYNPDSIYIVGDFWDFWRASPEECEKKNPDILPYFAKLRHSGKTIEKVVGNHDDGPALITICNVKESVAKIGNRIYLVIHGHQFDEEIGKFSWFFKMLNAFVGLFERFNINFFSGFKKSLSNLTKKPYYEAIVNQIYIRLAKEAKAKSFNGVIFGHTHLPKEFYVDDIHLINLGDLMSGSSCLVTNGENMIFEGFNLK